MAIKFSRFSRSISQYYLTRALRANLYEYNKSEFLMGWWRFNTDISTAGNADDSSGRGHPAVPFSGQRPAFPSPAVTQSTYIQANSNLFNGASTATKVTDPADNSLSFTDGSGVDRPFSVSFWVNPDFDEGAAKYYYIAHKGTSTANADSEYQLFFYDGDGDESAALYLRCYDPAGDYIGVYKSAIASSGEWQHFIVTYDGSSSNSGFNIYRNGEKLSTSSSSSGTYDGMERTGGNMGVGAAVSGGGSDFKGYLADVAIWNTKLSHNDALALYNATSGPYKSISGYLSLPPRVRLRTIDSATGSYPTIARTGDQDRLGNFPVRFDDTLTVAFGGAPSMTASFAYPQVLPGGSSLIQFPKSDLSVFRTGSVYALPEHRILSDDYTRSNNLRPFDDSRIRLEEDRFFMTGTDISVMPGFTTPLKNKTQITIDLQQSSTTELFVSTGSLVSPGADVNSGLAYYNFERKKWEIHGVQRHYETSVNPTGSHVNFLQRGDSAYTPSMIVGFRKSNVTVKTGSAQVSSLRRSSLDGQTSKGIKFSDLNSQAAGQIVGHTGYPYARVFEPSGSQLLSMSNYITEPFLVEKMVYEFSGTFGTSGGESLPDGAGINYSKFIVLRQGKVSNQRQLKKGLKGNSSYTDVSAGTTWNLEGVYAVNKDRDIVGFGDVTWTQSNGNLSREITNKFAKRDLTLFNSGSYLQSDDFSAVNYHQRLTGTYYLKFEARTPQASTEMGYLIGEGGEDGTRADADNRSRSTTAGLVMQSNVGGGASNGVASGFYTPSGRSFVRATGGITPSSSFSFSLQSLETEQKTIVGEYFTVSPYVLLPDDQICFSWVNQNFSRSFADTREIIMNLPQAPGKITLFGSLLRDNSPLQGSLNQNLTSDAIHETLHQTIHDTFDSEYRSEYIDTYRDNFITGTLAGDAAGDNTQYRRAQSIIQTPATMNSSSISVTSTQMTSSQIAGFERFVRILDPDERWYDTLMPGFEEYCRRADGFAGIVKAGPAGAKVPSVITWTSAPFPLEASRGYLNSQVLNFRMPFPYDGNPTRIIEDKTYVQAPGLVAGQTKVAIKVPNQCRRLLFSVGRKQGMPIINSLGLFGIQYMDKRTADSNLGYRGIANLSHQQVFKGALGYRYGIRNHEAENTAIIFVGNKFGQMRDMLEQRKYTRFYTNGEVTSSPIQIKFTRMTSSFPQEPVETASSNLSIYATSSLPYFDGKFRNRPDKESEQRRVSVSFGSGRRRGAAGGQN